MAAALRREGTGICAEASPLSQLVGAERPSVSHALARLADGGLVAGGGADWHLRGKSQKDFAWLVDHHLERGPAALRTGT